MNIPEEAVHAATDAIRDDLMRVPADIRALVLGMLVRANEAAAPYIAAQAWAEGFNDCTHKGAPRGTTIVMIPNPYEDPQ